MPLSSDSFTKTRAISFALLLAAVSLSLFGCIKRPRSSNSSIGSGENTDQTKQTETSDQQSLTSRVKGSADSRQPHLARININIAPEPELEKLPGIGKGLAERIIEHRERYGPFRRVEHLIIVRGISDKRFRALRELVTVE